VILILNNRGRDMFPSYFIQIQNKEHYCWIFVEIFLQFLFYFYYVKYYKINKITNKYMCGKINKCLFILNFDFLKLKLAYNILLLFNIKPKI
jgi:hypothetical protein